MIRKIVTALVLIVLALALIAFAVANRQVVTVSLDPFDQADPALMLTLPLYLVIFALLIVGVVLGGCAAWLRQSKWRGRARRAEAQVKVLSVQANERSDATSATPGADARLRLMVPPPAA
jgi:uncharacterized integral membrane protein